jgi:hypothetical protein
MAADSDDDPQRDPGSEAKPQRDPSAEGFEGWGGRGDYFSLKAAKLQEQTADKTAGGNGQQSCIFRGCTAHVNGHTVGHPP